MQTFCRSNRTTAGASLAITSPSPSLPSSEPIPSAVVCRILGRYRCVSLNCMSRKFCPVERFGLAGLVHLFLPLSQRIPVSSTRPCWCQWVLRTYTSYPHKLGQLSLSFSISFLSLVIVDTPGGSPFFLIVIFIIIHMNIWIVHC